MLYSIYLTLLFAERLAVALFDWGSWGKPDSIMACGCGVQNRPNTQVLPRHNFFSPFIFRGGSSGERTRISSAGSPALEKLQQRFSVAGKVRYIGRRSL